MLAADIPTKFVIPFADDPDVGTSRVVPVAPTVEPGAASLEKGFTEINMTPVSAGGVPPFGQDFNGLFNQDTAWARWLAAGGPIVYDATFQTDIGGYPAGTYVMSAVQPGFWWLCTADDNMTDPDAAGAGWAAFPPPSWYANASGTNTLTATFAPAPVALVTGMVFKIKAANTNTGAVTLNPNGLGAVAVVNSGGAPLAPGDIQAGGIYTLAYDGTSLQLVTAAASVQNNRWTYAGTVGGTANALTATLTPPPAAYVAGMSFTAKIAADNTISGVTVNVNGLGAKTITLTDGGALGIGDLEAGMVAEFVYDGTNFQLSTVNTAQVVAVAQAISKIAKITGYLYHSSEFTTYSGALLNWTLQHTTLFVPFARRALVDAIAFYYNSSGIADTIVAGIYNSGPDGYPNELIAQSAPAAPTTNGVKVFTFTAVDLTDLVWLAVYNRASTGGNSVTAGDPNAAAAAVFGSVNPLNAATVTAGGGGLVVAGNNYSAGLPATAPAGMTVLSTNIPQFAVRAA